MGASMALGQWQWELSGHRDAGLLQLNQTYCWVQISPPKESSSSTSLQHGLTHLAVFSLLVSIISIGNKTYLGPELSPAPPSLQADVAQSGAVTRLFLC